MADINIDGIAKWLENWFYNKTEINGHLNNKANQSDLQTTNSNLANLSSTVDNKVDKITGKGLSTEDFTTSLKDKLDGIEAEANKIIVDSALSSTSTNPVENKAVDSALNGKAPVSHATNETTYGVGTSSNYGHNKVVNNLNAVSNVAGNSLSAYQGKVLKDMVDTHSQASTRVTETSALGNIGTAANATQHAINVAINTTIGNLSSIHAIEVVTALPTASVNTLGKLYIINENSKINVYYTENTGTSVSPVYAWHKMDTDILDELSIDWADVQNKPSTFTPASHAHGNIQNDGTIPASAIVGLTATNQPVVCSTSDQKIRVSNILNNYVNDKNAHSNIGTSANATQETINTNIDTALGNKGAKTDDIDWSYNSNGFTNGVKLVDKATNANGRITLHLKS